MKEESQQKKIPESVRPQEPILDSEVSELIQTERTKIEREDNARMEEALRLQKEGKLPTDQEAAEKLSELYEGVARKEAKGLENRYIETGMLSLGLKNLLTEGKLNEDMKLAEVLDILQSELGDLRKKVAEFGRITKEIGVYKNKAEK
jgi:hypothetical protein